MIIEKTHAFCNVCNQIHPATIERERELILGKLHCRQKPQIYRISSDPDLYLAIRNKYRGPVSIDPRDIQHNLVNLVEITDNCNFHCPICYASSQAQSHPVFLTPDQVYARALATKARGGKSLFLTGGEPTVHPQLLEIVRRLRPLRLRIQIASNGYILGQDPGLTRDLKKAGVHKMMIQFDTFDPDVHQKMRGNRYIEEKLAAIRHCRSAGLRLGIITTVTRLNLEELKAIVDFSLSFTPELSSIIFQGASPVGRCTIDHEMLVDREQILHSLLQAGAIGFHDTDNIWPLPNFRPWGMYLHPDCAVNSIFHVNGPNIKLWKDMVDVEKLYAAMAANTMQPKFLNKNIVPLFLTWKYANPGKTGILLRGLLNSLRGRGRGSFVVIGVGSYFSALFQDENRIGRCPSSHVLDGKMLSPCHYNQRNANWPDSRASGS